MSSKTVLITGAAGNIAYSLIFKVANGDIFGPNVPVNLVLLDIPPARQKLEGVLMELQDCATPLIDSVRVTVDPADAFTGVDLCLFVGAFPRLKGMERKDLLEKNSTIFRDQGKLLNTHASPDVKIIVVGNPANTNCLILKQNAPNVPERNFSALTRLDHNRARGQLALHLNVPVRKVQNPIIWGNHSSTQYPDVSQATNDGQPVTGLDMDWVRGEFTRTVQKRGAAIINARGLSSAASAAQAIVDHARCWCASGTAPGQIVSMAVPSDGSYGIPEGVIYSYPVTCKGDGSYEIVQGLTRTEHDTRMMMASYEELKQESETANAFLKTQEPKL